MSLIKLPLSKLTRPSSAASAATAVAPWTAVPAEEDDGSSGATAHSDGSQAGTAISSSQPLALPPPRQGHSVVTDAEPPVNGGGDSPASAAPGPPIIALCRLDADTDIRKPPEHWLYGPPLPGARSSQEPFPSIRLAETLIQHPDLDVDLIGDATVMKRLLKTPFSKQRASFAVHRVGSTILVDDFDIKSQPTRTEGGGSGRKRAGSDSDAFRQHLREHVSPKLQAEGDDLKLPPPNRWKKNHASVSRELLLSKFLYHSVQTNPSADAPGPTAPLQERFFSADHQHLWTFQDMRMLVSSNMAIFGDKNHPAVSLRLRDAEKPIHLLTGLDMWLDNLMCEVPEVLMCFHLQGIVQNYELFKTEELPQAFGFQPTVVRDIAENVVSFLRSNATKEGHTYWLYKGDEEDAVRLYDLTAICDSLDKAGAPKNPFAHPVCMLLLRIAMRLYTSPTQQAQAPTIRRLLTQVLELADGESMPSVVATAQFIMADLNMSVPPTVDVIESASTQPTSQLPWLQKSPDSQALVVSSSSGLSSSVSSTRPVSKLEQLQTSLDELVSGLQLLTSDGQLPSDPARHDLLLAIVARSRAVLLSLGQQLMADGQFDGALEAAWAGLALGEAPKDGAGTCAQSTSAQGSAQESHEQQADGKTTPDGTTAPTTAKPAPPSEPTATTTGTTVPRGDAPNLGSSSNPTTAAAATVSTTTAAALPFGDVTLPLDQVAVGALLELAADATLRLLTERSSEQREAAMQRLSSRPPALCTLLAVAAASQGQRALRCGGGTCTLASHNPAAMPLKDSFGDSLAQALDLYQQAVVAFGDGPGNATGATKPGSDSNGSSKSNATASKRQRSSKGNQPKATGHVKPLLLQKLGNALNVLASRKMETAAAIDTANSPEDMQAHLAFWQESHDLFTRALEAFRGAGDALNAALIQSNLGKLWRVGYRATLLHDAAVGLVGPSTSKPQGEMHDQAVAWYDKAFKTLRRRETHPGIWDRINLEYAGACLAFATLIQDHPSAMEPERRNTQINHLLSQALQHFEREAKVAAAEARGQETPSIRLRQANDSIANVHHRLGLLHAHRLAAAETRQQAPRQLCKLAELHLGKAVEWFDSRSELARQALAARLALVGLRLGQVEQGVSVDKNLQGALAALCPCGPLAKMLMGLLHTKHGTTAPAGGAASEQACTGSVARGPGAAGGTADSPADNPADSADPLEAVQMLNQLDEMTTIALQMCARQEARKKPDAKPQQDGHQRVPSTGWKQLYAEALALVRRARALPCSARADSAAAFLAKLQPKP
eukprot:m.165807 g.165807  ORF g.165807 m.165807 type:complete len:1289 (+) comp17743_c1_seq4:199-4065(+)